MSAIQTLKKKLRGIRSTQKLTKAMKTIATVKYSKLNGIYAQYQTYGKLCAELFLQYKEELLQAYPAGNPGAPAAVVLMASNKGLCGNFNSEVLKFAQRELTQNTVFYGETEPDEAAERKSAQEESEQKGISQAKSVGSGKYELFVCGKRLAGACRAKQLPIAREFELNDVPTYEECKAVLDELLGLRKEGKISEIYIIYPKYINTMRQVPTLHALFQTESARKESEKAILFRKSGGKRLAGTKVGVPDGMADADLEKLLGRNEKKYEKPVALSEERTDILFAPDRETVINRIAKTIFYAIFYEFVLETALGAQAATLMTMRSAYETASDYLIRLEGEINRMRQSVVTADVLETASGSEEW